MCGQMSVQVEVWPVAVDDAGIWLVSGSDAWRSDPVPQDGDVHFEVETLLHRYSALESTTLIHSTSWRPDGPFIVLTYVAVLRGTDHPVRNAWQGALPISRALTEQVGPPAPNAATDPPIPRYIDVLLHAVRHLRFLLAEDATAAASLDTTWQRHLSGLRPALAGMYTEAHRAS